MKTSTETTSQPEQRVRDLGTLTPKGDVSIKFLALKAQTTSRKRQKEHKIQKGWGSTRKQEPLNLHEQSAQEDMETEGACTRPIPVCTKSSASILWLLLLCLWWEFWAASLGLFSVCWFVLTTLNMIVFVLAYIFNNLIVTYTYWEWENQFSPVEWH